MNCYRKTVEEQVTSRSGNRFELALLPIIPIQNQNSRREISYEQGKKSKDDSTTWGRRTMTCQVITSRKKSAHHIMKKIAIMEIDRNNHWSWPTSMARKIQKLSGIIKNNHTGMQRQKSRTAKSQQAIKYKTTRRCIGNDGVIKRVQ